MTVDAEAIVEYDPESVIRKESNAFDSEPEVAYMGEPFADDSWITEYSRELGMCLISGLYSTMASAVFDKSESLLS